MKDETPLDDHLVARLVRTQFPELNPVRVERLGEGCDSVAFDVNGAWVFRFPKRADVERQLPIEARLLTSLNLRGSPIPVPTYWFHGKPSDEFPRHFGGYSKLPGLTANRLDRSRLDLRRLAPVLGRFLSWLHAFPLEEALAMGIADQRQDNVIAEVQEEVLEEFPVLSRGAPDAPLDEWRAFFQAAPFSARPALPAFAIVHNDLAAEHVLVHETGAHVTGVIDWSDVAVGDRAVDFGGIFHWGGAAFLSDVLANYAWPVDDALVTRARFFAASRGVLDVGFGLERGDRSYVEGGLRAIGMAIAV